MGNFPVDLNLHSVYVSENKSLNCLGKESLFTLRRLRKTHTRAHIIYICVCLCFT